MDKQDEKDEKRLKREKIYKIIMIVSATAFITVVATTFVIFSMLIKGETVGKYVMIKDSSNNSEIANDLDKFRAIIDKYYFGNVDEEKLKQGAIKGYIEGLEDPYTEYIPKQELKEYIDTAKGNYVGIGIYMTADKEKNMIRVVSTIQDSPAEKVGIQSGDYIKSVDGVQYTAENLNDISDKIKGTADSNVKIEILRGEETLQFEIKREKVVINKIENNILEGNVGYIKIASFDEKTAEDFKTKYEGLKNNNDIKSLIIDLRNNGGGIVGEALKIADFIVDKDSVLLYEVDKNGKETVKKSENNPIVDIPVVILVNSNTASSSEILAGALKDLGKAKIVGTTTYGKGIIQQIINLSDGSGIKITTEEYQTPNRNKIHKVGIEPDEKIELPNGIKSPSNLQGKEDTQLKKAIEILKQ